MSDSARPHQQGPPQLMLSQGGTLLPVPDPTTLTLELVRRELGALRELLETRLDGMDKAADLLRTEVVKVASNTDQQILHLKALHDERFASVDKQFNERDERAKMAEQAQKEAATATATSASIAVTAALQAQKEAAANQNEANAAAITKSEASTAKQIDGISALMASDRKTYDDKISVINGRLDRGEGVSTGSRDRHTEGRLDTSQIVSYIVAAVAVAALVFSVIGSNGNSHTSGQPTLVAPAVVPVNPSQPRQP